MCFEYQKYMFFSAEFLSKFGGPPQFFWGGFPKKGKPQNTTQRIVFVKEGGGPLPLLSAFRTPNVTLVQQNPRFYLGTPVPPPKKS